MKQAGEEEKAIALSNSNTDDVPGITVIVDSGWSKRAHKHSYNAKSGVEIIIGKETRKILFMGVRNKYIVQYATMQLAVPYLDTLASSTGTLTMETEIIVEGFH